MAKVCIGPKPSSDDGRHPGEKRSKHLNILSVSLAVSLVDESNKDFNYTLHKMA